MAQGNKPDIADRAGEAAQPSGETDQDGGRDGTPRAAGQESGPGSASAKAPAAETKAAAGTAANSPLPAALADICPGLRVPASLEGQGLFPRRYEVLLRQRGAESGGASDSPSASHSDSASTYEVERFSPAPGAAPLAFADAKLAGLARRACDWSKTALVRALPGRFANGDPATLALLLEFTEGGGIP